MPKRRRSAVMKKKKRKIEDDVYMEEESFSLLGESTSSERKTNSTMDETIQSIMNQMLDQVVIQLEGVTNRKQYNLRNRKNSQLGIVDVNKQYSKDAVIIDYRVVFTYSSPYFSGSIDITEYDRSRLNGGNMLNDNIINFYLEHLYTSYMDGELAKINCTFASTQCIQSSCDHEHYPFVSQLFNRFHIFSTFFYSRISRSMDMSDAKEIADLMKWSKGKTIFEKEFVLIPVFSGSHWSLAVLCYPNYLYQYLKEGKHVNGVDYSVTNPKLKKQKKVSEGNQVKDQQDHESKEVKEDQQDQQDQQNHKPKEIKEVKEDQQDQQNHKPNQVDYFPCILVLNSLNDAATIMSRKLREFLKLALHELDPSVTTPICFYNLPLIMPTVTQQPNSIDCGVYLLLFAERMIQHYGKYDIVSKIYRNVRKINELFGFLQFPSDQANTMRQTIQNLISQIESRQTTVISDDSESDIECVCMTTTKKIQKKRGKKKESQKTEPSLSLSNQSEMASISSAPSETKCNSPEVNTVSNPSEIKPPINSYKRRIMPSRSFLRT